MTVAGSSNDAAMGITATPEACEALRRMTDLHGPIMLHVAGANSGMHKPVCLPVGELRIGARDQLLGHVEGVAIYQMMSRPNGDCHRGDYVIDMVDGMPVGFSLDAGNNRRFTILRMPDTPAETRQSSYDPHVTGERYDTY
jgi:uncharacterized protein